MGCIHYDLQNTGIPVNFGITIGVALIVGAVVAGQTFYLFTLENLNPFGALEAIGVTNLRLIGMILLQGTRRRVASRQLRPTEPTHSVHDNRVIRPFLGSHRRTRRA